MENEPDPLASAPRRVEAYLDQMLAPLTPRLSPFHRDELRRELREHLWARIEAYRELGQSEDEAVTEALHQFGGAEDFLRQWRREWKKAPCQTTYRDICEAGRQALWPTLLGTVAAVLPFVLLQASYVGLRGSSAGTLLDSLGDTPMQIIEGFSLLALPVVIGAKHGKRTAQRAGLGIATALTVEALIADLLYRLTSLHWTFSDNLYGYFGLVVGVQMVWIPLAGSAAALSQWITQRRKARQFA